MRCSQGPGNCVPCGLESASEEDTRLCCNAVVWKGLACTHACTLPWIIDVAAGHKPQGYPETSLQDCQGP